MSKFVLSFVFIFGVLFSPNRSPINYQPKSFGKQIEKLWGIKDFKVEEVVLSTENRVEGKFFSIMDKNNAIQNRYAYIGRVNSCRAGGCSVSSDEPINMESEYFDYFILFNSNIEVELVKVYNYQATHGQEVTVKGWLKQFIGYQGIKGLQVGKGIDAIAGATISVYAITADVEHKSKMLRSLIN